MADRGAFQITQRSLWLEKKKRREGRGRAVLDDLPRPPVWQRRIRRRAHRRISRPHHCGEFALESSGIHDAWRAITYEKGAWIMHMLRRRLGDDRFLKMLAELRRRYEFRTITTEEFRALAAGFLPPRSPSDTMDSFFDNWVYATGIPKLKLQSSVRGWLRR